MEWPSGTTLRFRRGCLGFRTGALRAANSSKWRRPPRDVFSARAIPLAVRSACHLDVPSTRLARVFSLAPWLLLASCAPHPPPATAAVTDASSPAAAPSAEPASSAPLACALPEKSPDEVTLADGGPANVLGTALAVCGESPRTGFYRDGRCQTGPEDKGVHVACAVMTESFLRFTAGRGNDLSTPSGGFPGLKPGDRWCLCAARWAEAETAGVAPPLVLEATHSAMLRVKPREELTRHADGSRPGALGE
jgi:uncharacterized protein